jgi:hypothetical protein
MPETNSVPERAKQPATPEEIHSLFIDMLFSLEECERVLYHYGARKAVRQANATISRARTALPAIAATRFLKDVKVTLKKDIVEPVDLRSYEPVATEHGIGIILKSQ